MKDKFELLHKRSIEKRKKMEVFIEILEEYSNIEDQYQVKIEKIAKNLINFNKDMYFIGYFYISSYLKRQISSILNNFQEYITSKNEKNKTHIQFFRMKFVEPFKNLLKQLNNEFKATMNDWKKMEKDSKGLLENYEKVNLIKKKTMYSY